MGAFISIDTRAAARAFAERKAFLDKVIADLREAKSYRPELRMPPAEGARLSYFHHGTRGPGRRRQPARPALSAEHDAAEAARNALIRKYLADLRTGQPSMFTAMVVGANAMREVWVRRVYAGGADIVFAALSPAYAARKAVRHPGVPIGIATGAMVAALRRAQVVVVKV